MPVREIHSTSPVNARLFLGGSGSPLSGWGMMAVCRMMNIGGGFTEPILAAVHAPASTIGVLYYDETNGISFGSANGAAHSGGAITVNATDAWLLGFTQGADGAVRLHAANVTTGGAAVHDASSTVTTVDTAWDQTEVGTADGGTFQGTKRILAAAIFDGVYSDADFEAVAAALSSQSIADLDPASLWDFDQASVATAVTDLVGDADQASITGTTSETDAAFDDWTPGVSAAPAGLVLRVDGEWVAATRVTRVSGAWV